jgi:hypothetical protein
MKSFFDKALLTVAVSLLIFLLSSYISGSFIAGLLSLTLSALIFFFLHKTVRFKKPEILSKKDFMRLLLLEGRDYVTETMRRVFSVFYDTEAIKEGITVKIGDKIILVYNGFKFGALSEEDVAASYRAAKQENIDEIYFFYNTADRRAFALANFIEQKIHLMPFKIFYKLAERAKALPLPSKIKKPRRWGLIFKSAVSYVNIKYFLFASFSTALLSLFTPLRVYYLIFSAVNVLLAIIVAIISAKEEKVLF